MHSIWIIGGALGIFAMWMFEVNPRWIGAFGVAWLGLAFNSIIQARNQADTALSSVGVMLKKRWDLIPSLVDAVQRYVEHESQLLAEVVALRAKATARELPAAEAAALDAQIGRALGQVLVTAESYPELKASESFQQLQRALNEVEEQISAARRTYNAATRTYNDAISMFPTNLLAALLGYRERSYFETTAREEARPEVMERFRADERR